MLEQSIAKIYIETELDTSGWERDLRTGSDRIGRLPSIKPRVDQSELHDLNKTLDLKQKHLRETVAFFSSNPINVSVNASELDNITSKRINIAAYIDASSISNINIQASSVSKNISNTLSKIALSPLTIPINIASSISTGALEGIGRQLNTGVGGALEKFINNKFGDTIGSVKLLSNKLSEELINNIYKNSETFAAQSNSKLAKKLRAFDSPKVAIQDFIGYEDVVIESYAGKNAIANKKKTQREKARAAAPLELRKATQELRAGQYELIEAKQINEDLSPRLNKEITKAEAKIKQANRKLESSKSLSSVQTERRAKLEEKLAVIQNEIKNNSSKINKYTTSANSDQATKRGRVVKKEQALSNDLDLDENAQILFQKILLENPELEASKVAQKKSIKGINKPASSSFKASQVERLKNYTVTSEKKAAIAKSILDGYANTTKNLKELQKQIIVADQIIGAASNEQTTLLKNISKAREKVVKLETRRNEVTEAFTILADKALPEFYQKRLDIVSPELSRELVPQLVSGTRKAGSKGVYRPALNQIGLEKSIIERFKNGQETDADILTLDEEIRHAKDFFYGSMAGVEMMRDNRLPESSKVKANKDDVEDIKRINKQLEQYDEKVREIELNAKIIAGRGVRAEQNKRYKKDITNLGGLEGSKISRSEEVLEGILGYLPETKARDFQITALRKRFESIYKDKDSVVNDIIQAQTLGIDNDKSLQLIEKLKTITTKSDKLKSDILKTAQRLKPNNKSYFAELSKATDDPWAADLLADKKRNRRNKPVQFAMAELVVEKESVLEEVNKIANSVKNSKIVEVATTAGRKGIASALMKTKEIGGKILNTIGVAYDQARGIEAGMLDIAPFGLGQIAKSSIQGAAVYSMLPAPLQALAAGGMRSAIGLGTEFLSSSIGGIGGSVVGGIGAAAGLAAPALSGSVIAKGGEKLLGAALPSSIKQTQRTVKELQADNARIQLLLESRTIEKAITSSGDKAKSIKEALIDNNSLAVIEKSPEGILKAKNAIDKAWKSLKGALSDNNLEMAAYLSKSIVEQSKVFVEANKEVYSRFATGSKERKDLSILSGEVGRTSKRAQARLDKFKGNLKKVELVPPDNSPPNDPSEISASSLIGDIRNAITKKRINGAERLNKRANLRVAQLAAKLGKAEADQDMKESESVLNQTEKTLQNLNAGSIGRTPVSESLKVGDAVVKKITKKLNSISETVEVEQPFSKSIKDFNSAKVSVNAKLEEYEKLLDIPPLEPSSKSLLSKITPAGLILVSGIITIGLAISGIQKALDRASAELALKVNSDDEGGYRKSLASAEAFSKRIGLSTTESIKQSAKFRASVEGTGLEGISDNLLQGTTIYGRAQGASKPEISRGLLALSQVASKPKLSAEELNQLAESIPGFGQLAASSSGYSQGQLRSLAGKGKINSADIIANLSPALQAASAIKEGSLQDNPQVAIDKIGASVENLQVKLAKGLLPGVAAGANLVNAAITFLNDNLQLLGTAGIVAIAAFTARTITMTMAAQGLSVAALFTKGALTAMMTAAPPLLLLAGVTALIDASMSLSKLYSGGDSPTTKMVEDYEQAAEAIAKTRGEIEAIGGVKLEGWAENTFQFLDELSNKLNRATGADEIKETKQLKLEGQRRLAAETDQRLKEVVLAPNDPAAISATTAKIKQLEVEAKIAGDLEKPADTAARNKELTELIAKRDKLNLPIQQDKAIIERQISALEDLIKSGNLENNAGAISKLAIAKRQLATLNASASEYADQTRQIDLKLSRSIANFSGLNLSLDRLSANESYKTINLLSGSLYTGTRSTLEFNNAWTALSRQLSASKEQAKEAAAIVTSGEIGSTIAKLQAASKLPKDLRDTSPEQFQGLKDLGIAQNIQDSIKFYNDSQSKLLKQTTDQAKLLNDRKIALANEDKALQDKYKVTIEEANKLAASTRDQTQRLLQSNMSAALRNSLIGISGAVGGYINSTIEIFEKLQEQTNIATDNLTKQSEITLQKLAASRDKAVAEQAFSGTPVSTAITTPSQSGPIGSIVDGGRSALSQPANMNLQGFKAHRNRGKGKANLHNGQDYIGALGANVRTPVAGKVVDIDGAFNWGGNLPSLRGVDIESIDSQGNKIVARYVHIAEKAGDAFKLKLGQQVAAGTILGVIGKDGKIGGNDYHVDVKTKVNGKYEDPATAFARLKGGNVGTVATNIQPAGDKTRSILDLIAKGEVGTTGAGGYYKRQNGSSFSGNTFPAVPKGENIGRYQVNRGDYDEARRKDPTITDFSPANQDKIAMLRMKNAGLKGRDKGYTALQVYNANPTRANLEILLRDLGAEWEALRDGKTRYQGRDTGKNYRAKLYGSDDSIAAMLGTGANTASPQTLTNKIAISNAPSPLIEADYRAKIASLEAQSTAGYEQANIQIQTSKIQAQQLELKRNQEFIVNRRKEAAEQRKNRLEQTIKERSLGDPSSNKDNIRQQLEAKSFITETAIKQKENADDYKLEKEAMAKLDRDFDQLSKRTDLNKDQVSAIAQYKAIAPTLKKVREELYKNTQLSLSQDIRIGKKGVEDLDRKRARQLIAENRSLNQNTVAGQIAISEAELSKAEQYLSANPYDYKYGDPLTLKKRISLAKEKESNAKSIADIEEQIRVLDPNAGNFSVQKAGLNKQLADLKKASSLRAKSIYSEYDQANLVRQKDKKDYIENIASDSVKRNIDEQKIVGAYESAQGRKTKGAETAYLAESAARNQQLKETIATLERAALLDPRLRAGLKDRIAEVTYQKQILDYTAERVRWTEREANLRALTQRSAESSFELRSLNIDSLTKSGNNYDAKTEAGLLAKDKLVADYQRQIRELQELKIANEANQNSPFYEETQLQLQAIEDDLDSINNKKLDALTREFSQFQAVIDDTAKEGTRVLSDMLSGKGVDNNSLNQLLVAPFKAINDQIASFLGGQWSKFVNELLGGVAEQLNNLMGQAGSAESPTGGNIFSGILNGIVGMFTGGGSGAGIGASVGSELSSFNLNFAEGGTLKDVTSMPGFTGSPSIEKAMRKERFESGGREPVVIVANRDEMVLNPMQTKDYLRGGTTPNYADGGALRNLGSMPTRSTNLPTVPTYKPLELKTTIIDNIETVSIEQLNAAMANANKANYRAMEQNNRQQQDRLNHNVDYRQSIGLL